jgi:hypothetical protein
MSFMRKTLIAFAVFLLASGSTAMAGGRQDFSLINGTGYDIAEVYVSAASSDDWEEDVLGEDVLENGRSVNIHFASSSSACKWDLMVVYTDGEKAEWEGFDLCKVSEIRLLYNQKSGETSAEYR